MSASLAVALVGAGRMGRVHLRALQAAEGVRTAAVVEPAPAVRAAVEAQGLPTVASVEELLARRRPDAAIVAAPSRLHLPLVTALSAAGVPVLCEKPAGLRADEARAA